MCIVRAVAPAFLFAYTVAICLTHSHTHSPARESRDMMCALLPGRRLRGDGALYLARLDAEVTAGAIHAARIYTEARHAGQWQLFPEGL